MSETFIRQKINTDFYLPWMSIEFFKINFYECIVAW